MVIAEIDRLSSCYHFVDFLYGRVLTSDTTTDLCFQITDSFVNMLQPESQKHG